MLVNEPLTLTPQQTTVLPIHSFDIDIKSIGNEDGVGTNGVTHIKTVS